MPVKQKAVSKKAAPRAADTEGHVANRLKATSAKKASSAKKAAPRAADTEGHVASRMKAPSHKR